MKIELKHIILIFLALISFLVLCHFRTVPVSQFWKGYRMLYVYSDVLSDDDVVSILENNGCSSVISSQNQRIPIISNLVPVQVQSEDSYLFKRQAFFTDKNQRASVFYVPENFSLPLDKAIRELSAFQGTMAGTDGKSSFPLIAPFISLLFSLILLYFSRKRLLFASGVFFIFVFAFSQPFYVVAASSCMYIFAFFLFHKFWRRNDFLRTALNTPYISFLLVAPVLILLLSSPVLSLFYLIALASSVIVLKLFYEFEEQFENKYSFKPVFIRTSRMIPVVGYQGIRLFLALIFAQLIIFVTFTFIGKVSSFTENVSMPSLPSPVNSSESELVQLRDFIDWTWNTVTFPYRKIGDYKASIPQEGEVVSITDYAQSNGKIMEVNTPVFVFNSDFRENVYKSIEKLDYPALEKLLMRQGKNSTFAYSKNASVSSAEKFAIPLLLILAAIPFSLAIYYILGRKRYGLSI